MEETSYYQDSESSILPTPEAAAERLGPAIDRIYDQIERVQAELPKTEDVMHKVVEAAEHNQAIEKLFELRHEVKDQSITQPAASSVTSMAGLIEQKSNSMHAAMLEQAAPSKTHQKGIRALLPPANSLYGQAVKYGFMTAVISLGIAILIVVLFT